MSKYTLIQSFRFAFKGLKTVGSERNFRLHLVSASIVIILGFSCGISRAEWLIILICTGAVISLELVNSAIEKLTDLISPGMHPLAGAAKDIAAAAVLVFSVVSAVIGLMIFIPYFVY